MPVCNERARNKCSADLLGRPHQNLLYWILSENCKPREASAHCSLLRPRWGASCHSCCCLKANIWWSPPERNSLGLIISSYTSVGNSDN